jgi:hypothetical protein
MATKKANKDNAKTRYDAKNPTVSFRVSIEEYERLDTLRKNGMSFRKMVLTGAGMIEKDKVKEKALSAAMRRGIEEAARIETLRYVQLGNCHRCGRTLFWNLNDPSQKAILIRTINKAYINHEHCPDR